MDCLSHRWRAWLAGSSFVVLFAPLAASAAIIPIEDAREAYLRIDAFEGSSWTHRTPDSPFSTFEVDAITAYNTDVDEERTVGVTHHSTIGADLIEAELRGRGAGDDAIFSESTYSDFGLVFEVDELSYYQISGVLNSGRAESLHGYGQDVSIALSEDGHHWFSANASTYEYSDVDFGEILTFNPGVEYRLDLHVRGSVSVYSRGSFSMTRTSVPEPASAALLGMGVAALGASRRRPLGFRASQTNSWVS